MIRIKMHISKEKLPFYPPSEFKYGLQNEVSTHTHTHSLSLSLSLSLYIYVCVCVCVCLIRFSMFLKSVMEI